MNTNTRYLSKKIVAHTTTMTIISVYSSPTPTYHPVFSSPEPQQHAYDFDSPSPARLTASQLARAAQWAKELEFWERESRASTVDPEEPPAPWDPASADFDPFALEAEGRRQAAEAAAREFDDPLFAELEANFEGDLLAADFFDVERAKSAKAVRMTYTHLPKISLQVASAGSLLVDAALAGQIGMDDCHFLSSALQSGVPSWEKTGIK